METDLNTLQPKSVMLSSDLINRKENKENETKLVKNTCKNRLKSSFLQTTSAFTEYPIKGLKGDKKSTFYEFLTMGTVPYLVGSATLIAIFNAANKFFPNFAKKGAKSFGNKMALGVIFYGLAKSLSKKLITTPVKLATGIDTEMPYQNVSYSIPTSKDAAPIASYEQHKVFETRDFPRFDILYGVDPEHPERKNLPRNYYYDKIAKKNGLGINLEASDTEVKPMLKDVISRASTAKSLSSYTWGAVGVMLATQSPWDNFFKALSKNSWQKLPANPTTNKFVAKTINVGKNLVRITKSFGRNFIKSAKELYNGPAGQKGFNKHAGKIFLGLAAALSIFGAANTIYGAKHSSDRKLVIDSNKKITVD